MRTRLIAVVVMPVVLISALSLRGQSRATNTGIPNVQVPGNASATAAATRYVGSEACKKCHLNVYNGWKQTRMANVVRDPREHPDAVLGDFAHSDPLRTFDLDQVAFATEAATSSAILRSAATTISRFLPNGISQ